MGNQIDKCCRNCMKIQGEQGNQETRFMEITGNFNKSLRCRKFFISSEPLQKQKVNQLVLFTDSSLTFSIPNFTLKLSESDIQKLQQALKCQMTSNNLIIKQNCFVLNAIQQQDSQYNDFKQFQSKDSDQFYDFEQKKSQNNNKEQNKNILENKNIQKKQINGNNGNKIQNNQENVNIGENKNDNQNLEIIKKDKNGLNKKKDNLEIEKFVMINKSRAFRFKNPLRKFAIGYIIVAIVPVYQKTQHLNTLKQSIQQGLQMIDDLKTVGVVQISFMLGYEASLFQKIILQYILGYSKIKRQYAFKRMNQFVYLTKSNDHVTSFFRFLNIYTKSKLEKVESIETLDSQKEKDKNLNKVPIRRLGSGNGQDNSNGFVFTKHSPVLEKTKSTNNNNSVSNSQQRHLRPQISNHNKNKFTTSLATGNNNNKIVSHLINDKRHNGQLGFNSNGNNPHNASFSSHNSSFSHGGQTNLIGFDRQRINGGNGTQFNNGSQQNLSLSFRSFTRLDNQYPIYNNYNNPNDISEIRSRNSQDTDIKNIRIKSFKSNQSNVSDYF